ncbi:hypothetical protein [Chryseobacterium arthrosphaerae]|uniref:hypothetical protein n=1 Tax=Chryseobacterium arthrosphaerae TaxID=651561 RepID=UPI001F4BB106|nr:hypothetical protein [Chryseobacterium arthrosphaerae]
MKKLFIIFYGFLFTAGYAQLGINTTRVQGIFHVDAGKDNPASGNPSAAQQLNDFVATSAGNVGIGKTNPQRKLDVEADNQPLSIQNLLHQVPADHNILVRDEITGDVLSAKYSYTVTSAGIPAGGTGTVTIPSNINIPSGMLIIRAGNSCGRTMISTYIYSNMSLGHQSSVARDKVGVVTSSSGGAGASVSWGVKFPNVTGCADGGNGTQFDYTLVKTAADTYTITNNGNVGKAYIITVFRL